MGFPSTPLGPQTALQASLDPNDHLDCLVNKESEDPSNVAADPMGHLTPCETMKAYPLTTWDPFTPWDPLGLPLERLGPSRPTTSLPGTL